jgi:hypothetical protein
MDNMLSQFSQFQMNDFFFLLLLLELLVRKLSGSTKKYSYPQSRF